MEHRGRQVQKSLSLWSSSWCLGSWVLFEAGFGGGVGMVLL